MRLRIVVFTLLLVMTIAMGSQAFNGERKGFVLGGGLGLGSTSYTQTLEMNGQSATSDREGKGAINTDFRIGYAPNNQLSIIYDSKVAWFGFTNAYNEDVTVSSGASSIALNYYLNPVSPSTYFSGGIAIATWSLPFEEHAPDPWSGFGIHGGIGYEFSRHFSGEFNLVYGHPGTEESGLKVHANVVSVMLTFNAIAY